MLSDDFIADLVKLFLKDNPRLKYYSHEFKMIETEFDSYPGYEIIIFDTKYKLEFVLPVRDKTLQLIWKMKKSVLDDVDRNIEALRGGNPLTEDMIKRAMPDGYTFFNMMENPMNPLEMHVDLQTDTGEMKSVVLMNNSTIMPLEDLIKILPDILADEDDFYDLEQGELPPEQE